MSLPAFVYHDGYDLKFGDHVFPSVKYKLIRERLLAQGVPEDRFFKPEPASDEDLKLAHTPEWISKLKLGTLSYAEVLQLEVPYSQQMVKAFWLCAGGTILAACLAKEHGVGFNIGGGFHHAYPGHGEGFCAIHDVAVAIRKLQKEGTIGKAMVVDVDVHHGNGTAAIFQGDASVFTLSIHQLHNYPSDKPPSTLDIHLADGVGDEEYLDKLGRACQSVVPTFRPDMLFYVAGADPYCDDQLGGLNLTLDGLRERDRMVIECGLRERIPVVITLAGGYARRLEDTVTIHTNTALAAAAVLRDFPWRPKSHTGEKAG